MKLLRITYLLCLISFLGYAQPRVETHIDTTKNPIGAQFNLTLRTNVDTLSRVSFPYAKNFGALEVIRNYQVDTVKKGDRYELIKRYGLTQFDSGSYVIPRLQVVINNRRLLSDSIRVEVMPVAVDTLKQKMFDIKSVAEETSSNFNWIWWLIGLVAVFGLGYLGYYLWKKRGAQKSEETIVFKTPIEKATTLLSNLENKQLVERGEVKDYYSQLTDIARTYIEEVIHIPAMESTTSELIVALRSAAAQKNMAISPETFDHLERVLKQADLVKFAKSRPMDFQIIDDRQKIEKVLVTIDSSVPEEVEEDNSEAFALLQEQKLKKKKRRQNIILASSGLAFVLFCFLAYSIAQYGLTHTWDSITQKKTLKLLESEWVKSEYGNPSVVIETPEVLMRNKAELVLPKETMALMKEFQMFTYGSLSSDFYIGVATHTYKGDQQIDLDKAMEGAIQTLEKQGAANMLVKQEEFNTREGVTGKKAYGTFARVDSGSRSSQRCYYEMLLFGQQNGIQLITLIYPEGDEYAKQISDRMLNSVELKMAQQ